MSRPQGPQPHPSFFPFDKNFRKMLPKGSYMSPHLLVLLNSFEEKLAHSLKKLMLAAKDNIVSFSWMKLAIESLCETHNDIKTLIVGLDLPVADWDEKWTNVYLNNSMNLLDLCNAFSSEISRLSEGNFILQCALRNVDSDTTKFALIHHSLCKWKHHVHVKSPRLENCTSILESIITSLNLPKVKNSTKGKVLMRAIYGLKVKTWLICSVFASAFYKPPKKLVDIHVPETLPWADSFSRLQFLVHWEISFQFSNEGGTMILEELEAVNASIINLLELFQAGSTPVKPEVLKSAASDMKKAAEKFSNTLNLLSTEVDKFFRIVLTGRDTLLSSLRSNYIISNSLKKAALAVK